MAFVLAFSRWASEQNIDIICPQPFVDTLLQLLRAHAVDDACCVLAESVASVNAQIKARKHWLAPRIVELRRVRVRVSDAESAYAEAKVARLAREQAERRARDADEERLQDFLTPFATAERQARVRALLLARGLRENAFAIPVTLYLRNPDEVAWRTLVGRVRAALWGEALGDEVLAEEVAAVCVGREEPQRLAALQRVSASMSALQVQCRELQSLVDAHANLFRDLKLQSLVDAQANLCRDLKLQSNLCRDLKMCFEQNRVRARRYVFGICAACAACAALQLAIGLARSARRA